MALAVWNGRISPVFDVATRLQLVDVERGDLRATREVPLVTTDPMSRAAELARLGVNRLVCGAISMSFGAALAMRGIDVISFVTGSAEETARACLAGQLPSAAFAMPGCGRGIGWGMGRGMGRGAGRGRYGGGRQRRFAGRAGR